MRPCFASIKVNGQKVTDDMMYEQVAEARGNRDKAGLEALMRDAVSCLKAAINGQPVDVVVDEPKVLEPASDFWMANQAVTELMAARRYLTNVLLQLSIDSDSITAYRLIELLDYFAEHPTEYLKFINDW